MAKDKKTNSKLKDKLINKYRLVILNEESFEEKLSLKLTRLNIVVLGGFFSILLIIATTFLIAFTPLKEYIPGYSSASLKKNAITLSLKVDSLQQAAKVNDLYIQNIKEVLTGKIKETHFNKDSILQVIKSEDQKLQSPSSISLADSLLRIEVEKKDRYSLFNSKENSSELMFFAPIEGVITEGFDIDKKHYALDIAVNSGSAVKVITDGRVIFSEWTAETGYVLIIRHSNDFISVYKHNKNLYVNQGDFVQSGQVIASSGNTGEFSTGPHLHFELWSDGNPVNPMNYIDFK